MASTDIQLTPQPAHELDPFTPELPLLHSSHGSQVAAASTGWMTPTSLSTPIDQMRARYERDGYVWVKYVLPREDVLDMREQYVFHLTNLLPKLCNLLSSIIAVRLTAATLFCFQLFHPTRLNRYPEAQYLSSRWDIQPGKRRHGFPRDRREASR